MDNSALKDYEELCRLCASYDAIKLPIFSERGRARNLKDKIITCLPFDVTEDDLLPKSLCYRCIYNLENFYDFRRGCIDARTRLENVIQEVLKQEPKNEKTIVKIEDTSSIKGEPSGEYCQVIESDGEADCPNPADFVEACWAESPHHGSKQGEDEEGTFPCKVCDRTFSSKSSLTIHAKFHQDISGGSESNKENYSCFVCDKVFSSKGHLALHSKVHIGETGSPPLSNSSRSSPANMKMYRCDLCSKTYSMAKHLWGHVSTTHKGHPLVTCGLCQRTFSSISNLEDHKRIKHKDDTMIDEVSNSPLIIDDESSLEKKSEELPSNRRKNSKPRKIERDINSSETNNMLSNSDSLPENSNSAESLQQNLEKTVRNQQYVSNAYQIEKTHFRTPKPNLDSAYSCFMCEERFRDADQLSQHLSQAHAYDGPLDFSNYGRNECGEDYAESMMEAETVFCCEICIREFNDRGSLWLHLLYSHKNAASKACGICLKICDDTESLLQHVETSHPKTKSDQRRYVCQVCARQHDSRKKLVTHAKIHRLVDAEGNLVDPETVVVQNADFYPDTFAPHPLDDNYLSCEVCFKVFENDSKLLKHKRSAHKDGAMNHLNPGAYHFYFACEICGLSHLSRADRWKHMSTSHAGDPSVTCEVPECGKVFPTSSIKKEHASHHAAQGQYPNTCEVCGKMWKTRVEYWKHMMGVHPDCLPFICGVCLKVFCNLTNLVSHVRETHWPLVGGDFCCDICGRPYSKVSKMTRHRKVHYVPDNPPELQALLDNPKVQNEPHFLQQASALTCDMCENNTFEYENIEALGKHRHEVHNVMPCDLCTKYYGRTSHLWKHVNKIHKGHPDVTCPTCQRTSASKSHLATHIAKHHRTEEMGPRTSKEKEPNGIHTCEKCSKVFRKESLVRKHFKHCKGPRPSLIPLPPPVDGIYTCEKCDKSFNARNLLYKHMKHSHIAFSCEACEIKTYSRTELYQHICKEHSTHPDFRCTIGDCDKILRCKNDLERHIKNHRLSFQLHFCQFCAELVTSKFKLRRHLKAIHGNETKFLCSICLSPFPEAKELKDHVEEMHKAAIDRGFTCQVCAKPCSNKSKLIEHMKYHGANYLLCKICLKIFPSKEELDNHVDNHPSDSGDEDDQVDDVELDTNSIMDIIGASKTDTKAEEKEDEEQDKEGEKRKADEEEEEETQKPKKKSKLEVECSVCSEIFYTKMTLRRHLKNVHNIKAVYNKHKKDTSLAETTITDSSMNEESDKSAWDTTADSDKNFMHQLGLMPDAEKSKGKPIRKVYSDDASPCECEICGKVWPAKKHLWQHLIRFHKNECGRTCGVCLKLCPDYPCLSAHLAIEHPDNFDDDPSGLNCRVCGKYHNAKTKLINHVNIHVGHEERGLDPIHHCLICKEVFPEFSQFCNHIRTDHNIGENGGQDDVNAKAESPNSEQTLNDSSKAIESHSKKLPFHTCEVCSLVFASEIGLTNHKRIHENSDNFKCGQCGEVFQSAENLCTHKLQKHKGTEFVCADCKSNFSTYTQLTEHNKLCKMKLKNLGDNSDDEELLLDDDIEELQTSYDVNETIMSSESDDLEKSGFPEENDFESQESLSDEDEKSNISEISHKEPKAVEAFLFDSNVEVVQVHLDDNSKL